MNDDTILRKIQKALALANDKRGDPNTAAIALRQAQKLMDAYGITNQRVMAANCSHGDLRSKVSVVNPAQWELNIVFFIGEAFGCRPLWTGGGPEPTNKGYFTLVGPKSYVEVALYTIEVTMRELLKARSNFVKGFRDHPALYDLPRNQKSKKADEFCLGWGWAVRKEIHKMADPDGLIKAAADAYANEKWGENMNKAKVNNKAGDKLTRAMQMGGAAGSEFKIHRPMSSDGTETLALGV